MNNVKEKSWSDKINKFEIILSIIGAMIQIGLFALYAASALTASFAVPAALVGVLLLLLLDYLRKHRILTRYKAEQLLWEWLPALAIFIEARRSIPEKFKNDGQVFYERVTYTFRINGSDGVYSRQIVGQNVSDDELKSIFYMMAGETSVGNGSVNIAASRGLGSQLERLEPTVVWSSPNVKIVGVDFNPPVAAKTGKLCVTFSGKWPGAFVSKSGYLFAAIPQCAKGVGILTMKAIFDEALSQCSVWTWDLKRNELKEFEKLSDPRQRAGVYALKWQRANPDTNKVYILRYKRNGNNLV
jgi:hypothetical protein